MSAVTLNTHVEALGAYIAEHKCSDQLYTQCVAMACELLLGRASIENVDPSLDMSLLTHVSRVIMGAVRASASKGDIEDLFTACASLTPVHCAPIVEAVTSSGGGIKEILRREQSIGLPKLEDASFMHYLQVRGAKDKPIYQTFFRVGLNTRAPPGVGTDGLIRSQGTRTQGLVMLYH
ncbi:hypothetical protein KIPB_010684 [Kipferlia bialata]|uniref:Uncharacterized protein n=1 Tax=Kipferlia bialata TaxID=797122 RepID=A0A9K3GN38_9EUKA|nr:hypothetical protein KIPB_010684 [Kipferlia bialata]|eukprot:g10684.t1